MNDEPPTVLGPFAGGGSIALEGLLLGKEQHQRAAAQAEQLEMDL